MPRDPWDPHPGVGIHCYPQGRTGQRRDEHGAGQRKASTGLHLRRSLVQNRANKLPNSPESKLRQRKPASHRFLRLKINL